MAQAFPAIYRSGKPFLYKEKIRTHRYLQLSIDQTKTKISLLIRCTSLEAHWLRHRASNADGMGLIPGQETMVPHAAEQLQAFFCLFCF